jgi:hypothetical protein
MITVPQNIKDAIANAAKAHEVDESLLTGIAYTESKFDPGVINGTQTSKTKVQGLFQITGKTWSELHKSDGAAYSLDVVEQANTAAKLVKQLSLQYNNDVDLITIAYNAGPGVADRLRGKNIDYANISSAVQYFIDKNEPGFGSDKINEVWRYPQRVKQAMGYPVTISTSIPVNPTQSTNNVSGKTVTSGKPQQSQKYNPNYTVAENFTLGAAGTALASLSAKIMNTPDLKTTKLVRKIRSTHLKKVIFTSFSNVHRGR